MKEQVMSSYEYAGHRGPYRLRNGVLLGVCAGIAEHFDLWVFWTRIFTFIAFWCTGIFPVGVLYVMTGLLMKKAPLMPSSYVPSWDDRLHATRTPRNGSLDERLSRLQGAAR